VVGVRQALELLGIECLMDQSATLKMMSSVSNGIGDATVGSSLAQRPSGHGDYGAGPGGPSRILVHYSEGACRNHAAPSVDGRAAERKMTSRVARIVT
jgi:hypothetical protein